MFNGLGAGIGKASRIGVFSMGVLLSGCGGGGSSGGSNSSGNIQSNSSSDAVIFNAESGSRVDLKTINGNVLYTTNADSNGDVKIDRVTLNGIMLDNNLSDDTRILLEETGGIDMDPDKNGELDDDVDMAIDGTLSAVLKISELDYSRINVLTTLASKILRGTYGEHLEKLRDLDGNIDMDLLNKKMSLIISGLGTKDINEDGELDNLDLINYDMVFDSSALEDRVVASGLSDTVYTGDLAVQDNIIYEFKKGLNLVSTEINLNQLSLIGSEPHSSVYYSFDNQTWRVYSGRINIEFESVVYYKELYENQNYGKVASIDLGGNNSGNQAEVEEELEPVEEVVAVVEETPIVEEVVNVVEEPELEPVEEIILVEPEPVEEIVVAEPEALLDNSLNINYVPLELVEVVDNGVEFNNFSVEYPEIVEGPVGDLFTINWYDLGVGKNDNNLDIQASIISGAGSIYRINGNNLEYRPESGQLYDSQEIVVELTSNDGSIGEVKVNINNVNTGNFYRYELYCSGALTESMEDDIFKEYWIKTNTQIDNPGIIKGFVDDGGCHYVNTKYRWLNKATTVYGISVKYMYQERSDRIHSSNAQEKSGLESFKDHEFTGKQKYLRPDGVWVDFNIGRDSGDKGGGYVRDFLEKEDYFFDQLNDFDKNHMLEFWEEFPNGTSSSSSSSSDSPVIAVEVVEEESVVYASSISTEVASIISSNELNLINKVEQIIYEPTPVNFSSDGLTYTRNGITFSTDTSNLFLENTIKSYPNTFDYIEYPFTIYVKLNRTGNGTDYPALVWIEFGDQFIDATPRVEIFSREELNYSGSDGEMYKLENSARALIDINREILGTNTAEIVYEVADDALINKFTVNSSNNIVKNSLINLSNSSTMYVSGMGEGIYQAGIDSYEMMLDLPGETVQSLKSYGNLLIDSIAYWQAKGMHSLTGDPIYGQVEDMLNDKILDKAVYGTQEIEDFYVQISGLKEDIQAAIDNLKYLENPEYWGGYLNGYLDVLVTEGVTITLATRNAVKAIGMLKKSKAYIAIQRIIARINVAGEIYKLNSFKINFNLFNKLDNIEVEKYEILVKQSLSLMPVDKQARFFDRMNKMDEFMYKEYVNQSQKYIDTFEVGGTYNSLKEVDDFGKSYGLEINDNGKFKKLNGNRVGYTDFVMYDDGTILFGENHSFLTKGKNVVYAGGISISQNSGKINSWNCATGHYLVDANDEVGKSIFVENFNKLVSNDTTTINLNDFEFTGIIGK